MFSTLKLINTFSKAPFLSRARQPDPSEVIFVSFSSQITGKFKGFVHMKTDALTLLIPVEIMVTKGGVHVTPELVDFQTLVSPSQSRLILGVSGESALRRFGDQNLWVSI